MNNKVDINNSSSNTTFETQSKLKCIDIYFIRHGETIANRDGILQGHCDYPLTELGLQQAQEAGDALKEVNWRRIYTSDLPRAYNTGRIICSRSIIDRVSGGELIIQNSLIREKKFGVKEALPKQTTLEEAIAICAKNKNIPKKDVVDDSESTIDVIKRQREFVRGLISDLSREDDEFVETQPESDNILCVSHGGFIRIFIKAFSHIRDCYGIENCAISKVHVEWKYKSTGEIEDNSIKFTISPDSINIRSSDMGRLFAPVKALSKI